MELVVTNENNFTDEEQITLADQIFASEFKEPLVHQVVTAYLANARAGTKAQKTRGQVRGGGKKPWKQKGTGGARAGTIRSPLWRGGGIVFAAVPRDFKQKINRKMYRLAMSCILSELIRQNRLKVVTDFTLVDHKTKGLLTKLKNHQIDDKINTLIVTYKSDLNLNLATRNVPSVSLCEAKNINPVILIKNEQVVITKQALNNLNAGLRY